MREKLKRSQNPEHRTEVGQDVGLPVLTGLSCALVVLPTLKMEEHGGSGLKYPQDPCPTLHSLVDTHRVDGQVTPGIVWSQPVQDACSSNGAHQLGCHVEDGSEQRDLVAY